MHGTQGVSYSRLTIIVVVFLMLAQSFLITTDSNTDVLTDDSDWFEGMVDDEEGTEDFSMGGYDLLSNRWWQPSASRFNVTVNDSDGDGWDNAEDPMPHHPAIPAPMVASNCKNFRPTCSLLSEGFAGMDSPDFSIPHAHTMEMGLGDFDGDGDLDFARSGSNHKVAIFTNENGTSFSEDKYDWGHGQRDSTAMAWADIDNDGDLDLTSGNSKWTFHASDQIFLNE